MRNAPHPFTLRQLQYVLAVAETLSFRKAAEACRVSQPSLSAQLAQVEDALGVRLFERDRRRVLVTPAAKDLLERARRILLGADDLVEAAAHLSDPLAGPLRIGVIPTISPYLLPSVAPALRRAFPRLTPIWTEEKTEVLLERLRAGELDAAILATRGGADLAQATIAEDPFVLVASPSHELGRTTAPATPKDLQNAGVLLLDEGHCFRDQALAFCGAQRAQELEFRATSLSTLVQMVAGGAGVTLIPALSVPTEAKRAGLRVRRFTRPAPHRTITLAWRKGSPLEAALKEIAGTLRTAYPEYDSPKLSK